MKLHFLFFFALLFLANSAFALTRITSIKKISDGFYLMYYDTSSVNFNISKSAIVEFEHYIILLEMPIAYSNSNLTDHTEGGEKVLMALKDYFPNKPLKYIVSSHWHPHSISSVLPFISNGITVITTRNNFKKIREFVDSPTYSKYHDFIQFVENDSMKISDKQNSIVLYKCKQRDYTYLPTEDFLYAYLPKYKCLQTSCMYQRIAKSNVRGKELISGRVENLYSFIKQKGIDPENYLCTDIDYDDNNGLIHRDSLESLMQHGIGMVYLENEFITLSEETIESKGDSLLKEIITNPIPHSIFNRVISSTLARNELKKALALAKLQALLYPSDPYSWDTYGEVYYFLGEMKIAKRFELQATKIDKNFKDGGEKLWQEDKANFAQQREAK